MENRGIYAIVGVVVGAGLLGYAGYRNFDIQARESKKELVMTNSTIGERTQNAPTGDDLASGLPNDAGVGVGETPGNIEAPLGGMSAPNRPFMGGGGGMRRGGGSVAPGETSSVPAQQQRGGGETPARPRPQGGGEAQMGEVDILGMGGMILNDPKVATELKLSDAQKKQITDAMKPPAASGNGGEGLEGVARGMRRASAELGPKLRTILNAQQVKRYEELVFQQIGPASMMGDNFKTRFAISDAESEKMQKMAEAFGQEMMASLQSGGQGGGQGGGRQMPDLSKIMKAKADFDKKLVAALDADSQAKWKSATGKPFTFSNPMAAFGGMMGGMGGMGGGMGRSGGGPGRRGGN